MEKLLIRSGWRLECWSVGSKDEAGNWGWRLSHGKGQCWGGYGTSSCNPGTLLRRPSCAKVREAIELLFGVSGVDPGIDVSDRVHV